MSALAGKRVLVVEDEFLISRMVAEALLEAEAVVIGPAATQEAALDLARREQIDVAVIDVNLRGVRSDKIAEELHRRAIPFVVATGYGEADLGAAARVLAKPFTPTTLLQALETVLPA